MEHQSIGHDLEHCLHGENHQEHIFYLFLRAEQDVKVGTYLGPESDPVGVSAG